MSVVNIRPFLGQKLGIPLGKIYSKYKNKFKDGKNDIDSYGTTIDLDFGCGVVGIIGNFVLGGDIRYGVDFNKVQDKVDDEKYKIMHRCALVITITAAYRFK